MKVEFTGDTPKMTLGELPEGHAFIYDTSSNMILGVEIPSVNKVYVKCACSSQGMYALKIPDKHCIVLSTTTDVIWFAPEHPPVIDLGEPTLLIPVTSRSIK